MTAPRLPFLYPNLLRSVRSCEPTSRSFRLHSYNTQSSSAGLHSSCRHDQETFPRRYGSATESRLPPPPRPKDQSLNQAGSGPAGKDPSRGRETTPRDSAQVHDSKEPAKDNQTGKKIRSSSGNPSSANSSDQSQANDASTVSKPTDSVPDDQKHQAQKEVPSENPLEAVLQMPSPSSQLTPTFSNSEGSRPPHLAPPPYIHHFDTYTLVKDLEKGGFSEEQAVTVMKAVRGILQHKLELARQTLTSKSDIENELYLFKAACSELQTSLQTARNAEIQNQRASRTQLQHEVDILSQRLNQELASLSDDLKGIFNDHKMTTKELQRGLDTGIQELNYKITVSLNSDGKSEVEGLRWILTRRAALAIATSAFMIIIFLKYYSVHTHVQKTKEVAAKEATTSEPPKNASVQTESLSDTLASESLG